MTGNLGTVSDASSRNWSHNSAFVDEWLRRLDHAMPPGSKGKLVLPDCYRKGAAAEQWQGRNHLTVDLVLLAFRKIENTEARNDLWAELGSAFMDETHVPGTVRAISFLTGLQGDLLRVLGEAIGDDGRIDEHEASQLLRVLAAIQVATAEAMRQLACRRGE